mgnify:CR=1 FL=1
MTKMILKKVYISRGGVKANLEKVYILIFFYDGFPYAVLCTGHRQQLKHLIYMRFHF